ncbi:hypothetical protein [Budvicia aquatica]|uniref:hypothetical protein n=1 Tax=Budvicia aquatica TaxID=82979 RepID=UPI001C3F5998|nr:hypothetical protein [Budvicia aquatica]
MKTNPPKYVDERFGLSYPIDDLRWCSERGAPLMITPLPGITRDDIETKHRSLWRYQAALPVEIQRPISLGEGCTPLVGKRWVIQTCCSSWSGLTQPVVLKIVVPQ